MFNVLKKKICVLFVRGMIVLVLIEMSNIMIINGVMMFVWGYLYYFVIGLR